jgi:hypothetical protein
MDYNQALEQYRNRLRKVLVWWAVMGVPTVIEVILFIRIALIVTQSSELDLRFNEDIQASIGMSFLWIILLFLVSVPAFIIWIKHSRHLKREKEALSVVLKDSLAEAKEAGNTREEIEIEDVRQKLETRPLALLSS